VASGPFGTYAHVLQTIVTVRALMAASVSVSPVEVVVAGHICLDVIPMLHGPATIEPGGLIEIGPAALSAGGAVPNTGLALRRLGVPVRLMGKVGDDLFGRALLAALEARDPELAGSMVVAAGETTSYTIVISPPGVDRSFLHCSGANDTFTADDVRYDELTSARIFHFGYPPIMRAMYADGGTELRRMLARARDAGPTTSLDMCRPDPSGDAGRVDW
jgi:sugar/nucleoside kinase (ribokinase family)